MSKSNIQPLVILTTPGSDRMKWLFKFFVFNIIYQSHPDVKFLTCANQSEDDPYYESLNLWNKVLESIYKTVSGVIHSKYLEKHYKIRNSTISKSILMALQTNYFIPFAFARLYQKHSAITPKYILCAPPYIRSAFENNGLSINHLASSILWFFEINKRRIDIFSNTLKRIAGVFLNIFNQEIPALDSKQFDTLVMGLSDHEFTPSGLNFFEFLKDETRIEPLSNNKNIYVLAELNNSPLIENDGALIAHNKPFNLYEVGFKRVSNAFKELFSTLYLFLSIILKSYGRSSFLHFISEDILLTPRIERFLQQFSKKRDVVLTNSMISNQPIWLDLFKNTGGNIWMVFYSSPFYCSVYNHQPAYEECEPIDRYWHCTHFAVWNEEMKNYLIRLNFDPNKIFVLGPIIFGKKHSTSQSLNTIPIVTIFDIYPWNLELFAARFGIGNYHNNFQNMRSFISDIYSALLENLGANQFKLILKSKKNHKPWLSSEYHQFLTTTFVKYPEATLYDTNKLAVELVANSNLIFSAPFTSTAFIGSSFNIPSYYYDPTARLRDYKRVTKEPSLISGKVALSTLISEFKYNWMNK